VWQIFLGLGRYAGYDCDASTEVSRSIIIVKMNRLPTTGLILGRAIWPVYYTFPTLKRWILLNSQVLKFRHVILVSVNQKLHLYISKSPIPDRNSLVRDTTPPRQRNTTIYTNSNRIIKKHWRQLPILQDKLK
jgi:hypothetical protein